MAAPVRILHLEDSEDDALLIARRLKKRWPDARITRVETEEDTWAALRSQSWDAVLSDQTMPNFDAEAALGVFTQFDIDIPFIVVSGTIAMEDAVTLMKKGAHDFVEKTELGRLIPALERELADSAQRREAADQVRREQENQANILNAMDVGVYIADQDHELQYANPAIERMFGPYRGQKCFAYFYERDAVCPWCERPAAMQGSDTHWEFEAPVNGRIYDMVDTPITNRDGSVSKLKFLKDITDYKREQARLQQADKMDALGDLAGGIAHDLKNMLLPIITLTTMTLKDLPADGKTATRLRKVLEAAERARSLTEKIHAFSHSDDAVVTRCEVAKLLTDSLELLKPALPSSITVETDIPDGIGEVEVDPAQFSTMILNLGSNAADAMEGMTGTIAMTLTRLRLTPSDPAVIAVPRPGDYAELTFSDTGAGMDEKTMRSIFEPYFTTKEKGKGTGLGMAMVQKYVVQSDGGIDVGSAPGQGTTFRIRLPLVG